MGRETEELRCKLAGTECSFQTGRIARQASAAVLARSGDCVILATVVGAKEPREGVDFLPLTVDYREKLAAVGRIPGAYNRREGRITEHEILTCRLIDRTLRSLFPKNWRAEVQVQVTVLSADPAMDSSSLALLAACAALHLSPLPAKGPAAGLRIVGSGDSYSAFPSLEQRQQGQLDFVVATGPEGLVMVEGEAREVSEEDCAAALGQALEWLERLQKLFAGFRERAGKEKWPLPERASPPGLPQSLRDELAKLLGQPEEKQARAEAIGALRSSWLQSQAEAAPAEPGQALAAFDNLRQELVREQILSGGARPDGRGPEDIRPISCEVGWLPRCHGSAIFTRGETQALVSCTLGTPEDALRLEGLAGRSDERFLLHYNFPPYSVGEIRPLRGPGRREIGHGHLARRGLFALLPSHEVFPYTIRVESDISESNGSSSMATVCGASLAMFQAGVPLARAVAGIAMGMVTDGTREVVLSDILGEEDRLGDMDFKVVGTQTGITALQLDNKIGGLALEKLCEALQQARRGRLQILGEMARTMAEPAAEMPKTAPRVQRTAILPGSIGALVGPRGAHIKEIEAATGARVSVDDDGVVLVYAADGHASEKAMQMVHRLAGVLEDRHYYRGVVTTVRDFGAFVRINQVNEGLVPRGELAPVSGSGARDGGEPLQEGSAVVVRVLGTDEQGRLRLSIRAALGVDEALIDY